MSGTIDVNVGRMGDAINYGLVTGQTVLQGISGEGTNIGTALGLTMTVGLYIGLLALIIVLAFVVVRKVKGFGGMLK